MRADQCEGGFAWGIHILPRQNYPVVEVSGELINVGWRFSVSKTPLLVEEQNMSDQFDYRNRQRRRYDFDEDRDYDRGFNNRDMGYNQDYQMNRDYGYGSDYNRDYGYGGYNRDYGTGYGGYGGGYNRDYGYGGGGTYGRGMGRGYQSRGYGGSSGMYGRGMGRGYQGRGYGNLGSNYGYGRQQGFGTMDYDYDLDTDYDLEQGFFNEPTSWTYTEYWLIPGPFTGRGPKGYTRSDERIKDDISDRLTQHGQIDASDVNIDVNNGEVFLRGEVDNRRAKRMAEDVVESIPGVKDVHNELKVKHQEHRQREGMFQGSSQGTQGMQGTQGSQGSQGSQRGSTSGGQTQQG